MRVSWDIDRANRRLYTRHTGRIGFAEIAEILADSARHGTLHFQLLADATEAVFDLLPTDAQRFMELLAQMGKESNLGQTAVVTSGDTANGIIHMLAQLATGFCSIAAFNDHVDAERWLGWRAP
ncbi:MAG: hypothetical protein JWL90_2388 [Chthoniobacteraceae bacterium]|jgi:hypothetical protein|nr:hypothetical protein [Chthoniobacteraceae bacterium]